jgi:hypothetical protein
MGADKNHALGKALIAHGRHGNENLAGQPVRLTLAGRNFPWRFHGLKLGCVDKSCKPSRLLEVRIVKHIIQGAVAKS